MSDDAAKSKNSKRRYKDEIAIKRQLSIAKNYHGESNKSVLQPHRLTKRKFMDCGVAHCPLCGNRRAVYGEITAQEKRLFQDMDNVRDTHSNGLKNGEDEC